MSLLVCALHTPVFFFFCLAEIEAKEACDWLRAAGFPQYAQLYEGKTHSHKPQPQGRPVSHTQPLTLVATSPVLFFPSSCCLLSSSPSGRCFLFPGSSSHPEGWVMGKAFLSLLGLIHPPLFILSPFPFLVMSTFSVTATCFWYLSCLSPPLPPFLLRRSHYCMVSCI